GLNPSPALSEETLHAIMMLWWWLRPGVRFDHIGRVRTILVLCGRIQWALSTGGRYSVPTVSRSLFRAQIIACILSMLATDRSVGRQTSARLSWAKLRLRSPQGG